MRVLCATCRHIVTVDLNDVSCPRCGAPFQHLPRDPSGWRPDDTGRYLIPLLLWQSMQSTPDLSPPLHEPDFEPGGGEYGGGGATTTIEGSESESSTESGGEGVGGEGAAGESA